MAGLSGKVVLVTGSSAGIGAATAERFAAAGCHVALVGRNEERLKAVAEKCRQAHKDVKVHFLAGDVTDTEYLEKLVKTTTEVLGPLFVLQDITQVNNVGMSTSLEQTIEKGTMAEFDKVMDVNLKSVVILVKLCLPILKQTQGRIVNVSSAASIVPEPPMVWYSMSKAAMDMLTKCMAIEFAPHKIRVNSVNPGGVRTDFFSGISDEDKKTFWDGVDKMHLLGRCAEPIELAETILFLASDVSSFMTGHIMLVDGGYHLQMPINDFEGYGGQPK